MSTKIVELAVKCVEKKVKVPEPIKLVSLVNELRGTLDSTSYRAKEFSFASLLVARDTTDGKYDIIVCWNESRPENKYVFFGHWGDGVVG